MDHIAQTVTVYDAIAQQYAQQLEGYAPFKEREKFLSKLTPQSTILDAGCAAGRDSIYFASKGHHVTGVDLSEKLLVIAKAKTSQVVFLKQDLRKINFKPQSFDAIWACAVLLHLKRKEIPMVLKNFYALLNAKGILYVQVKQGEGERDVSEKLSSHQARHFIYFLPVEFKEMLIRAGFYIDEMYSWNERDRRKELRDLWWISAFARK